jgi:hypothetical protein
VASGPGVKLGPWPAGGGALPITVSLSLGASAA